MRTGALAQVVAFAIEAPAPPFPALVLGYAINGFGAALQVCNFEIHQFSRTIIDWLLRMRERMVMLQVSKKILQQRWASCMQYMVSCSKML